MMRVSFFLNQKYNLSLTTIVILLSSLFACGPITGLHEEESDHNTKTEPVFVCGNAVKESINTDWAAKQYGLKNSGNDGHKLFKQNCAVCHSLNDNRYTGAGLMGVIDRVPKPEIDWLKGYILNSDSVLKSGDAYAKKLHAQSGDATMTNFKGVLSDEELNDLLIYIIGNTR